jgi:hypothetical protein
VRLSTGEKKGYGHASLGEMGSPSSSYQQGVLGENNVRGMKAIHACWSREIKRLQKKN